MNAPYVRFLDLRQLIEKKIKQQGGWVNSHAHLDRSYTLSKNNLSLTNAGLHEKWSLVDEIKAKSSVGQIYDRMAYALENMLSQKVQAIATFIDIDEVIKDKAIKAAQKIKQNYQNKIKIKFVNQVLKGVLAKQARYWFDIGAEFVDIIGGLPSKDAGFEAEHLDIILSTAKKMGKMVHVHVDQLNTAKEKETELLAKKTLEHKMQGRVVAIHGISIGAHHKKYRQELYQLMQRCDLHIVCCPTAWIDSRRTEELVPNHNSIAPVDELIPQDINVSLGSDNICDIYKPFSDGSLWTELRVLLESCHFYEVEKLVEISTTNGLKALGIN